MDKSEDVIRKAIEANKDHLERDIIRGKAISWGVSLEDVPLLEDALKMALSRILKKHHIEKRSIKDILKDDGLLADRYKEGVDAT